MKPITFLQFVLALATLFSIGCVRFGEHPGVNRYTSRGVDKKKAERLAFQDEVEANVRKQQNHPAKPANERSSDWYR